jgi:hypothetical protein
VLTGPWRSSEQEAMRDAARAKQAALEDNQPSGLRWIVPGRIEEEVFEDASTRLRN